MRLVSAGLENILMYLDDVTRSDEINHVATLATFLVYLNLHKPKRFPDKYMFGSARVNLLGHVISADDGVRPDDECHHSSTHAYAHGYKTTNLTLLSWLLPQVPALHSLSEKRR